MKADEDILQSSLSGPLWLELLLFSSSLPRSLSSVVFCILSSSVLRAFGSPALFKWIDLNCSVEAHWRECLSVCSAPTCGSCICPLSPTLSGRSYFVNDCQYVRLPHVGVVFVLWVLCCLDVPTSPFLLRSLSLVWKLVGTRQLSSLVCTVPKARSTEEEKIQKTTEDRDCCKEDDNSNKWR